MKTVSQSFGVTFLLRNNTNKADKAIIYARIIVDGLISEFSLKRNINPACWNKVKGCAKGTKQEIRSLNEYLDKVKIRLYKCREKLLFNQKYLSRVN